MLVQLKFPGNPITVQRRRVRRPEWRLLWSFWGRMFIHKPPDQVVVSNVCLFSPFGDDSHFDSYFSTGLKPPTTWYLLCVKIQSLIYIWEFPWGVECQLLDDSRVLCQHAFGDVSNFGIPNIVLRNARFCWILHLSAHLSTHLKAHHFATCVPRNLSKHLFTLSLLDLVQYFFHPICSNLRRVTPFVESLIFGQDKASGDDLDDVSDLFVE